MKSFIDYWYKLNWDDLSLKINSKTSKDVYHALNTNNIKFEDIMSLLSPVALCNIELIAQRAKIITRQRFGNIVNFFVPLYLSNLCSNDCTYCGFSIKNKIKRKILNKNEIDKECRAISKIGFKHILLVTGEHEKKVGMDYFIQHIPIIRHRFASLQMEIQPLSINEYIELKKIGVDGVITYQETYNKVAYLKHHLKGKKQDFFWRLKTPERLGQAGINKIGLGVLTGLSNNWRVDHFMMAVHLDWLRQNFWKSQYSVSFPRLRPCIGGVNPSSYMNESQLLQTICTFRIIAPEIEISLSTRESPNFRDHVIPIAINNISAFSKTYPGGYASNKSELEQFVTYDNRHPYIIAHSLINKGMQPVWKDWDNWEYKH